MGIAWNWSRRHLHLVGVTGAVVVVAGAAGGYVGLTSTGTSSSSSANTGSGGPHVAGTSSKYSARPSPAVVGDAAAGSGAVACPMVPAMNSNGGTEDVGGAAHVFTRTTADGVTIRAYRLPSTGSCGCGPILGAPTTSPTSGTSRSTAAATAEAVAEGGSVSVELSDETAVGDGVLFDTLSPSGTTMNTSTEPVAFISNAFGVVEGAPVWWAAVSVGPGVAQARMSFADGSTDQMSPVDGVAVLAHQIDPSVAASGQGPYEVRGSLQLIDSSGAVIKTVTFPEPAPTPVPLPAPVPVSPPSAAPRSVAQGSVGATASPPVPNGSVAICSGVATPAQSAKTASAAATAATGQP
jgi:hypothetical protein